MTSTTWWKHGAIYHIYPRSFADSDGDGVGDLPGITAHLDYLSWLGVEAIWLSPFYRSPQRDFGYDITDHTDVDPLFGTLADFDHLLAEAHRRGLRVILDFVPNHTSIDHPWFAASRTSADDPKRDWYIWRDSAGGGPPNNWRAVTGGPAWTLDSRTGQYYLHSFLPEQPDLNWRHPEVRQAMHQVMRFWLDRGVDGFRIDMVDYLLKDEHFRDEPLDGHGIYEPALARHQLNQPGTLALLRELRDITDGYPGRVLIGEVEYRLPLPRLAGYYGQDDMLHLPINFWLLFTPWQAHDLQTFITAYDRALPGDAWPNWVLGSHDISRMATRLGRDQVHVALMLLFTLRGTPVLYYGDELGMTDVPIPPHQARDPWEGRDPARTPMPWTSAPNAGFSPPEARPWLPLGNPSVNVAAQKADPGSVLNLTRALLGLRRGHAALRDGSYQPAPAPDGVLAYRRSHPDEEMLITLNLTGSALDIPIPGEPLLSTHSGTTRLLLPHEGRVTVLRAAGHVSEVGQAPATNR
ncbi:alpha-amylase family glycosyl hydrolase [Streptosporangium sp. CA-135522]|uniref:alpha-amylase family glycosyl hydrolase n=1 Tax=Streptosporangium sp. CA-135522 TaxID=3240072 RepID=UPI003D8D9F42